MHRATLRSEAGGRRGVRGNRACFQWLMMQCGNRQWTWVEICAKRVFSGRKRQCRTNRSLPMSSRACSARAIDGTQAARPRPCGAGDCGCAAAWAQRGGEGVRNLGRKPLIRLDSEKEMQGNANVLSLFSTSETASTPAAARSRKSVSLEGCGWFRSLLKTLIPRPKMAGIFAGALAGCARTPNVTETPAALRGKG